MKENNEIAGNKKIVRKIVVTEKNEIIERRE